MSQAPVA